jgi:Flp pilus assembly protein CpaB
VNVESSVAGFIMPGSRVDVTAVPKDNGPAKIILTNVQVGAVGQSMSRVGEDGKSVRMEKSVTLFLRPEEVQVLHAYTGSGRLRLALRGAARDPEESPLVKLIKNAMTERPPPAPKVKIKKVKPPETHVVNLVRGQDCQKLIFDSAGNMRRLSGDAQMPAEMNPIPGEAYRTPAEPKESRQ